MSGDNILNEAQGANKEQSVNDEHSISEKSKLTARLTGLHRKLPVFSRRFLKRPTTIFLLMSNCLFH